MLIRAPRIVLLDEISAKRIEMEHEGPTARWLSSIEALCIAWTVGAATTWEGNPGGAVSPCMCGSSHVSQNQRASILIVQDRCKAEQLPLVSNVRRWRNGRLPEGWGG